jgi:succinyl-diaminopimelate desuccinylase
MTTDIVSLTKKLLSFNTINPPGDEAEIAKYSGELLAEHGFRTEYYTFEKGRLHLVAERGLSSKKPPIVLSGHFDTVPLGNKDWITDPFAGELTEGKIHGRGSSDMKGGLAAMMLASIQAFEEKPPEGGIRLIFTAAEELGCIGVQQLTKVMNDPGRASAIIVGEPTANIPYIAHKGAVYLNAVTSGKTSHSSMPELGVNAIYKAAKSIIKIMNFRFDAGKDPLLGFPTINVGRINGGMNINSVPDHAEFTIDIRSTTSIDHAVILAKLGNELGNDTVLETLVDLKPVFTDEKDPFVQLVYDACGVNRSDKNHPRALPYLTDGSVLQRIYNGVPTVILGPGQPEMAHQTDEYCYIKKLEDSVSIYKSIIMKWGNKQ